MKLFRFSPKTIYYFYRSAWGLFFSFITTITSIYHIQMVGLNPLQLVLVGTVLEAAFFLSEIPTGIVADRKSRRLSMVIGLMMMGAGFFLEGTLPVFGMVLAAQVIWGAGATFLSGADTAWITDETGGQNIERILLRGAQYQKIFMFLGIFASIALASIKVNLPFQAAGLGFLGLGLFLQLIMPERHFSPSYDETHNLIQGMVHTFKTGVEQIRGQKMLKMLVLATLIYGLFNEGFDRLWTWKFLQQMELPLLGHLPELLWFALIHAGAYLVNLGLVEAIFRRVTLKREKTLLTLLALNQMVLNATVFLFALTGRFDLALASYWMIYGLRHANQSLTEIVYNNRIQNNQVRATVLSMKGQADAVGQVLGGPFIGFLAYRFSVTAGLTSAGILFLPVLLIYLYLRGTKAPTPTRNIGN